MMPIYTHAAAGIAGLAIGFAGAWNVQGWRLGAQIADLKTQHEQAVSAASEAARLQSEKFRAIEQELSHVQGKAEREAQALHADLASARDSGRVASTRLRDAAATAATAARVDCQIDASAELRKTAASAARVSSDVLGELEQRARILGTTADERGIAGRACERLSDEAVKLTSQ